MPEDATDVITCRCGRRLNVRGARPGRMGKCPACGSTFRVPEGGLPTPPKPGTRTLAKPKARPDDEDKGPGGGYDLGPTLTDAEQTPSVRRKAPPPANPERFGDPRKPRKPVEAVGRGGILPLPKETEATPLGSLLYPVWDGYGLAWLVVLPPVLTVASLMVFGLIPVVMRGGNMALFGPAAFGSTVALLIFGAYALLVFQSVLVASAKGNVHHPGWPDFELGDLATALVRWAVALGVGVGPCLYASLAFLGDVPEGGPEPAWLMGAAAIASAGGIYSLVALVAVCLFEDLMAVSPLVVLPAVFRLGLAYVAPLVFWFGFVEGVVLSVRGLYRVEGFWVLLMMTWVVWVGGLYGSVVQMRMLGRAYKRRAREIGWFPEVRKRKGPPREPAPRVPVPDL